MGDQFGVKAELFGDGFGHPGQPFAFTTGEVVLKRAGTVIGSNPYPPGLINVNAEGGYAAYQLEATAERGAPVDLSTRVSAVWSFNSDTTSGTSPVRMPIWSVSFQPALNASNTARAGTRFTLPAKIVPQPGSTAAALRTVTVQYSTDDGATWTNATVTGSGANRTVTVVHPNITGFVSLRATAADVAGNSVQQTIIHAYRIAP